jgi:hypothetical protein
MDKAIEQAFKIFNHLAREIQIYLFSGLVIGSNLIIIDYFYYRSSWLTFIQKNNLIVPTAIILYLIGQFCMAFYYMLLELTKFDKKINKCFGFKYNIDSKSLPSLYAKNTELYLHFVERFIILTMMRWTVSAACFINILINIIILFRKSYHWQFFAATIIFAIGAVSFYLLSNKTEKDYAGRIDSLKDEKLS